MKRIDNLQNIQQVYIKNIKNKTQSIKLSSTPDRFERTTQTDKTSEGVFDIYKYIKKFVENVTNATFTIKPENEKKPIDLPFKIGLQFFAEEENITEDILNQRYNELQKFGVDTFSSESIAEFKNTQYKQALELLNNGVSPMFVKNIAILEDLQYRRALDLLQAGVESMWVKDLAIFENSKYEHVIELLQMGVPASSVKNIALLEGEQYNKALELLQKGVYPFDVTGIAMLEGEQYKRALELVKTGIDSIAIKRIAVLNDNQYQQALELIKTGVYSLDVINIAQLEGTQYKQALELLKKGVDSMLVKHLATLDNSLFKQILNSIDNIEFLKKNVLEHPELYINGESDNIEEVTEEVNNFFRLNYMNLIKLSVAFDKETMNNLLRMRFEDANKYLDTIDENFNYDDIKLLCGLCSSSDTNGKPILPAQKIEFIDLITAYKNNNSNTGKMYSMIEKGRVDVSELNYDLFCDLLKNCGFEDNDIDKMPVDKLKSWNPQYIHLLSKEINNKNGNIENSDLIFKDILQAGICEDFKSYIQDTSNKYGMINANTKAAFEHEGMNYSAWLEPDISNTVSFCEKDKNTEQLSQIAEQLTADVEALLQTPAKEFLNKQLSKYIKNNKFVIPPEYTTSKAKLSEFTKNIQKQFESIFKRAEGNLNNPEKATTAQNTLTIKNHLQQRLEDIEKLNDFKTSKTTDITIKMWERNPQKDLFQGNYSTCCIALGDINGDAMPHYLLNTAYNMIELTDNKTGNTIGNALCYFAKNSKENPVFIVDNIEIKNSEKQSKDIGIKLRNAIAEYAANVAKEVTGKDDIDIYMSNSYNDVPTSDLSFSEQKISFLGDIDSEVIYMDLYNGWTPANKLNQECEVLKMK